MENLKENIVSALLNVGRMDVADLIKQFGDENNIYEILDDLEDSGFVSISNGIILVSVDAIGLPTHLTNRLIGNGIVTLDVLIARYNDGTLGDVPHIGVGNIRTIGRIVPCLDVQEDPEDAIFKEMSGSTLWQLDLPDGVMKSLFNYGITDIDELTSAFDEGRLKDVKGFGTGKLKKIGIALNAFAISSDIDNKTFEQYMDSNFRDARLPLRRFLRGESFQQIVKYSDMSVDRLRQIINNLISSIPPLREDVCLDFYRKYSSIVTNDLMKDIFGFSDEYLRYIDYRFKNDNNADFLELFGSDEFKKLSPHKQKKYIQEYGYVNVSFNGHKKLVKATRQDIILWLLDEVYEREAVSFDELYEDYEYVLRHSFNRKSSIPNGCSMLDPHSFRMCLHRMSGVILTGSGKRGKYRYFDDDVDVSVLVDSVMKHAPECAVMSCSWFLQFRDVKKCMNECHVDGYKELHGVLHTAKNGGNEKLNDVKFERCPTIVFGDAKKEEQMESLIESVGSKSISYICSEYEKKYGVPADVARNLYYTVISAQEEDGDSE